MCIKCGYYFKDYDHSVDLSDNLTSSVLGTNQDLANFLTRGFWENSGTVSRKFNLSENGLNPKDGTITYNTVGNSFDADGISTERSFLVNEAFKLLEVTMGFDFQETDLQADINFGDKYINSAFAYADGRSYSSGLDFVNINIGANWNRSESNFGDYTFQTILHEIGHSLGLGHQGLYNGSERYFQNSLFRNDSWQSSIMSYFSQTQNTSIDSSFTYLSTYMSVDWIALDNIYSSEGISTENAFLGDTTFGFNTNISLSTSAIYAEMSNWIDQTSYTLVDGSGIDTVDFSGFISDQLIDLRETDLNSNTLYASNIGGKIGNLTIASGTTIENAIGGNGSDLINGNSSDNQIFGNDGDDVINSGKGDDIIDGGSGYDVAIFSSIKSNYAITETNDNKYQIIDNKGNDGTDIFENIEVLRFTDQDFDFANFISEDITTKEPLTISGTNKNDILVGTNFKDIIRGLKGKDKLYGKEGDDEIYGNSGKDKLYGEIGDDYLEGGSSKDKLYGGSGQDILFGGSSADKLYGGDDNDKLYGGSSSDKLYGQSGDDYIKGHSGNDKLYGSTGNDILWGGVGKNDLYGGSGNDIFKLNAGKGYDRIRDFKKGEDKIDISDFDLESLRIVDTGKHTRVYKGSKDLLAIIYNEDEISLSDNSYLI
ncbi:M10 family metallopeptidase C-terminal domain-containing protein [Prochlorococcus marinus]|uniref:Outer membrane secretion protein n=1 Tax=Prochlorococcus marinus str. SB TaxID=59926 RepID=A0A0A2B8P7_PROMR|nr:M10 family metallopeptidase C-terminal domain-containing protein [Prochlorococcus marinus]KGG09140.1 outer membrane secretion protein [Prochlorococcus marinus str. SB]